MRKIILNVAISLDGLIEGPKGEFDWCFTDQDYGMTQFLNRIDTIFYGRKSYEVMMAMDGKNPFENKASFVFSNTLKADKAYTLIRGDVVSQVTSIKNSTGKDIWLFGGAALTAVLMEAKLVDELLMAVHPIVLGKGKPMFGSLSHRMPLELLESHVYSSGLVSLHYKL